MSEGSVVPVSRRYYMTLLTAATGLSGVRVQYSPVSNIEEALGDNGRIEVIHWGNATSDVELRGMRATAHVKYQEHAQSELHILVMARTADELLDTIEGRAASLLGEVVKVIQTNPAPTSPGSWLHGMSAWVDGWTLTVGTPQSATSGIYVAAYNVDVHFQGFVEQ